MNFKKILCVPFDPVHDVGIKIIKSELEKRGHFTELLSPDLTAETIVKIVLYGNYDFMLVSRTLGYGVAELLARFIDLLDAAGVREKTQIILGGKPITPELAAELGFDKGFGEHSSIEEIIAYIEDREYTISNLGLNRSKKDIVTKYDFSFNNPEVESLLSSIADKLIDWAKDKTSPGVERAKIKEEYYKTQDNIKTENLLNEYYSLCSEEIINSNGRREWKDGRRKTGMERRKTEDVRGVRKVTKNELLGLHNFIHDNNPINPVKIQHNDKHPLLFKFLGSGCPVMDIIHAKVCERYGIDGFLIINPSWEARYEGLIEGCLTHENDGTITSYDNIRLVRESLDSSTLLTVRAHRGLNTPETVLLAGLAGADLAKINLVYGSLGAGTDPVRMAVDGIEAMKIAAKFNLAYDIPGNDELSGVPAWKTLAGLLINVMVGKKLGAKGILKPLFCYGPHIVLNGLMKFNYIDYNAAKIIALRKIINSPIWPGEPIAFMTQSEERVQSANSTSYHAALAASLGVDAITIASTDEAYSRGPICITSRIDSIRAVTDAFKFIGNAGFQPTQQVNDFSEMLIEKIIETLKVVESAENLPQAINKGYLGSKEDGAYPGTFGAGTVTTI